MASRAVFERNLAALKKRSIDLVDDLAAASTDGVEEEIGPRGAQILVQDGVRLGSAYDPEQEGRQIAERMAEAPADIMVAVGFGLGEQFAPYLEHNPATLIIYEPSLARLKAALSRLSISELVATHRDLYFASDPVQLTRFLNARYTPGLRMRVFPHPAVLRLDQEAVAEAVKATRNAKDVVDVQRLTSIEMLMPWAWVTARNGRRIAETPQFGQLSDAFEGKPAVVVAAGPSLDKQLALLEEIQERVVVIGIGQTTGALRDAGIDADFVHVLESRDVSHQLTDAGETSDLIVAPSADADPAIFDVPSRAKFTVTSSGGALGVWIAEATGEKHFSIGGGTVAQGAVGMAMMLGCNPIALIGQDLAFTDGRRYAKGTAYDYVGVEMKEDGKCRFDGINEKAEILNEPAPEPENGGLADQRVVWVDGWEEGEKVPTWRAYASFLEQYRDIGLAFQAYGISLINCTEGGARIPEVEHRTFRSFADEFATEPLDARRRILEVHDAATRHGLADYAEALAASRKRLDKIESEARKGARFAKKSEGRLAAAKNDQQRIEVLRRLARLEKRVRKQLEDAKWLDMFVQPEIYNAIAAVRRTERQDPTDENLVEESIFLFEATRKGIARARSWFEAFEASFDCPEDRPEDRPEDTPDDASADAPDASAKASAGRAKAIPAGYAIPPA
ncbi:MAG: 6-hydroxymethylpterin diphosphokinase MptE-like protein [Myxococcota bacterium]